MEAPEDSKADIVIKEEFPFIDVSAIKQEPIFDEVLDVMSEIKQEWPDDSVEMPHIDVNDIKEEPAEIIVCKTEIPCSTVKESESSQLEPRAALKNEELLQRQQKSIAEEFAHRINDMHSSAQMDKQQFQISLTDTELSLNEKLKELTKQHTLFKREFQILQELYEEQHENLLATKRKLKETTKMFEIECNSKRQLEKALERKAKKRPLQLNQADHD